MSMCGYVHVSWAQVLEEDRGIGPPGDEITGTCELLDMGAGVWTWVL